MMNKELKALRRCCIALACVLTVGSAGTVVRADETVNDLQQQTTGLQQQLDALNNELISLSSEVTELASKIEETDAAVQKATLDLAAAQLNEQIQYDAMKKRIKYMYETGNATLLELIFSSESMGDFLNKTEFVKNVTEYDREMLEEMQTIHNDIAAKETALKEEQAALLEMKVQLDSKQGELSTKISSTSNDLQASAEALSQAKAAQEAAAKAAAEEAEQAEQAAGSPSSPSAPSGGQTSGGSGTSSAPSYSTSTDEMVLFAAILQCEAGSSNYDGLLAVATVIMNRVNSGRYPDSVSGVIYQSGQFSPTWNGSLNRVLSKGPSSLCYTVAQDALNGARLASVSGCYQFRSASTGYSGTVVGGNVFF